MGTRVKVNFRGRDVDGERLTFKTQAEEWNIYSTEDGTKIKMKTVVSDIVRIKEYNQEGQPIYLVKSTNIVEPEVPEHLMLKPKKKGEIN